MVFRYLKTSFTESLHSSVRNALLDDHKLVYSFLLSLKTLHDANKITDLELSLFHQSCSPSRLLDLNSVNIEDTRIKVAESLSESLPSVFHNLPNSFRVDASKWQTYWKAYENEQWPTQPSLPIPWNKLTDFQKLILVNRIKPEATLVKITRLVEGALETKLSSLSQYSVARSFEESSCLIPLIFILPSYLEVSGIIAKWVKTIGYSSSVSSHSMGAIDDNDAADTMIDRARKHGGWVLLENCHLASDSSLSKLEKICESLEPSNTVLSFRLWLTSYPSERFPTSILQNSVKIHWDAPKNRLKESLLRFYQSSPLDEKDFYNRCPGNNKPFSKLVYALCFFHATMRARKEFQRRAWNVGYEFTDADLKISIERLQIFFNDTASRQTANFDALLYLIGECYYNGRILDPIDRHRLCIILRDYCNSKIIQTASNFVLVKDREGFSYSVPNRSEYHDYMKHIDCFIPNGETPPEIFHLDDNAAFIRDHRNVHGFFQSLSAVDGKRQDTTANCDYNTTYDHHDAELAIMIQDISGKLIPHHNLMDIERAKDKYPILYSEPLNGILIEEVDNYNELVGNIVKTINDLARIYGEGLPPLFTTLTTIHRITRNFLDNRVPINWMYIVNRDQDLPHFFQHLLKRREFLDAWMEKGHRGSFWLGGLLNCKKFVCAIRLTLARQRGIDLSRLTIRYKILKSFHSQDCEFIDDGSVHVHGLFLSGARWDIERSTLVESLPKLYWYSMPVIRVESTIDYEEHPHYYNCPVNVSAYAINNNANSFRSGFLFNDYVTSIDLDSKDTPPEHWIKRAATLFCNK